LDTGGKMQVFQVQPVSNTPARITPSERLHNVCY